MILGLAAAHTLLLGALCSAAPLYKHQPCIHSPAGNAAFHTLGPLFALSSLFRCSLLGSCDEHGPGPLDLAAPRPAAGGQV